MPSPALTPALVPQTYAELRRAVETTLLIGQREMDQARVRTYWETGRIITGHLRLNESKPGYGTATMSRLARDLKVSDTVLYRCVRFVESFPILATWPKLTWAHFRVLIPVEPTAQRLALTRKADNGGWTVVELEERVRPLRLAAAADTPSAPPALLTPKRGTPGVCKVIAAGNALVVDLGFACYLDLPGEAAFEAGALVTVDATGRVSAAPEATKADLFNYRVELLKVVDGDTLWVKVYLRPGQWVKQKLRLRGLDCPEMSTPEGKAAKRFVDALIAKTTTVVINTTKPDKYDRYLADVFLTVAGDGEEGAKNGRASASNAPTTEVYLNNALLENGQAVRKDAWQFGDWEPELVK